MRKTLPLIVAFLFFFAGHLHAQPATRGVPVGLGRINCGSGADSVYFFDYLATVMNKAVFPASQRPRLRIGPALINKFSSNVSSISFNPKDQKLYFLLTIYPTVTTAITYVWRWRADTSFPAAAMTLLNSMDTIRSFPYDMAGVAFDNNGLGWAIEFPPAPCNRAFMRPIDFAAGIYNAADTLDFIPGPTGLGDTLFSVSSGDITRLPNGQMYYNFDNKLYTPDYQSWVGGGHIKSTYIDTTALPAGASALVGLGYADGDLIAAYQAGTCTYKKIDPITGIPSGLTYNYAAGNGVASADMTQINSGIGAAKKLVSVLPTGTPGQYDVVYDVFIKNYGSVADSNVQVKDNLASINGASNLSNVTAVFTYNPLGLVLNAGYNGNTNDSLFLPTGGPPAKLPTLPNYPTANNNFIVRISCRLSNIIPGTVYNNSAIVTATGWINTFLLRDSSTNGTNPDLNQNDKPDDVGEGQPTPFVIIITPTTPPCSALSQVLYTQNFGTGTGLSTAFPAIPSASCLYAGSIVQPLSTNRYALADTAIQGNRNYWLPKTDHTGGGHGKMLLVNADAPATIFYRDTMPVACPGQQYSVSFWAIFVGNNLYRSLCNGLGGFKYPKFLVKIRDLFTGLTITQFTTADLTDTTWQQLGMKWVMPSGFTNVILELSNAGAGGCGNDFAIDDIQFGICDAAPTVSVGSGCIGLAATFTSALSDPTVIPGSKDYQWQVAPALAGPYVNIIGANAITYVINPVTPADTGKYYRVIITATGNMGNLACQYISPGVRLVGSVISIAATSATKNKNNICPGIPVNLGITGGTLGTSASWVWYSGSCGGTLMGTGTTLSVTPAVTTTYFVRAEGACNNSACQQVTVTISCNIDKDKDGIPDFVESNMPIALQDANANGIINAYDPTYPGFVDNNNDFINDNFQADGDSNNDGIPNYLDPTFPGRIDTNGDGVDDRFDTDKDGIINMLDLDSDNDGIPDVVEAGGVDANGDGKLDNFIDADGDGLSDQVDFNLGSAYNSGLGLGLPDFDGDGVPNYLDLDSDNDGIPDCLEVGAPDINNDGKPDGFVDANLDGLHDGYINATALLKTGADINGDGKADSYPFKNMDNDAKPNPYDMDSDGDGIVDVVEAGLPDANLNGIVDGIIGTNGWSITISSMAGPLAIRSTDGDGKPDYLDIDSDNDGIPDNIEGQTTAGYKIPTLTDTDGDGLADVYDNIVGFGGTGIVPVDTDMDGLPDYRDLDSDADGAPDIVEGNDFNMNGFADDLVTLTGLDTDGDGLDNRFDSLNSVLNIKGTSYRMGAGGSFVGDPAPGARCPLTKKFPADGDRAWRWVGSILPVQFLQFGGVLQSDNVLLSWSIITPKDVDHFEVERSMDNRIFSKVGTVKENVMLNTPQSFGYTDDISAINTEIIYYRLKVIGKAADIAYSNVLVVRRSNIKTPVSIVPNPAQDYVWVKFFASNESTVSIRLIDNLGKILRVQQQKVTKGNNIIQVNNLLLFSNGVYSLQVVINGEVVTQKLVLAK